MSTQKEFPTVNIVNHPLAQHNLTIIRSKETNHELFMTAFRRLGTILLLEAFNQLPLQNYSIETPLTACDMPQLDKDVRCLIVPILRAGLGLSEIASTLLPTAAVFHIGMYRDEQTHLPVWYYDKTPSHIDSRTQIFIMDPMLATGHSALTAIDLITQKGVAINQITFVSVLSAPEGLRVVLEKYPDLRIITSAIDTHLNERAYIVPGLGDAGDRLFNSFYETQ